MALPCEVDGIMSPIASGVGVKELLNQGRLPDSIVTMHEQDRRGIWILARIKYMPAQPVQCLGSPTEKLPFLIVQS